MLAGEVRRKVWYLEARVAPPSVRSQLKQRGQTAPFAYGISCRGGFAIAERTAELLSSRRSPQTDGPAPEGRAGRGVPGCRCTHPARAATGCTGVGELEFQLRIVQPEPEVAG